MGVSKTDQGTDGNKPTDGNGLKTIDDNVENGTTQDGEDNETTKGTDETVSQGIKDQDLENGAIANDKECETKQTTEENVPKGNNPIDEEAKENVPKGNNPIDNETEENVPKGNNPIDKESMETDLERNMHKSSDKNEPTENDHGENGATVTDNSCETDIGIDENGTSSSKLKGENGTSTETDEDEPEENHYVENGLMENVNGSETNNRTFENETNRTSDEHEKKERPHQNDHDMGNGAIQGGTIKKTDGSDCGQNGAAQNGNKNYENRDQNVTNTKRASNRGDSVNGNCFNIGLNKCGLIDLGIGLHWIAESSQHAPEPIQNELKSNTNNVSKAGNNELKSKQYELKLNQSKTKSNQIQSKPSQNGSKPDQNGSKPSQNGSKPDQNGSKPDQNGSKPDQNGSKPDENESKPDENESKSNQNESKLNQNESKLNQNESKSNQNESKSNQNESKASLNGGDDKDSDAGPPRRADRVEHPRSGNGSATRTLGVAVVLAGDPGVGKSSIVFRYYFEHFRDDVREPPMVLGDAKHGDLYLTTGGQTVKWSFVDGDGIYGVSDRTISHLSLYSQGLVLVYDVTDRSTFDSLDRLWTDVSSDPHHQLDSDCCLLVGNKSDLDRRSWQVSYKTAKAWADRQGIKHFVEMSSSPPDAQTRTKVKEVIDSLVVRVVESRRRLYDDSDDESGRGCSWLCC